ncbi:MAG: hypothetical protein HOH77_18405, partial [Candidatus Latescibacteria bacterium]|nr:hypothetical protein [Candidatus Latescibacterota bacterium]
ILPLAASVAGFGFAPLKMWQRAVLLVAALVLFLTPSGSLRFVLQGTALVVAGFVAILDWRSRS